MKTYVVTGGAGFIGSNLILYMLNKYVECLKAIKDFNVKGCVILEGPLVEKDALLLKNTYKNL